jgi:hypothetical protein
MKKAIVDVTLRFEIDVLDDSHEAEDIEYMIQKDHMGGDGCSLCAFNFMESYASDAPRNLLTARFVRDADTAPLHVPAYKWPKKVEQNG